MASLKKNFSIAKLYSDLEKYQANLVGFKDSRLKRQASGASLHQRPNSTQHKNYESRESFGYTNLSRFQKPRLQVGLKSKNPRPTYQNFTSQQKSSFLYDRHQYQPQNISQQCQKYQQSENNKKSQQSSILKQTYLQNYKQKQNKPILKTNINNFNKSDEVYFLNECTKLYKLNQNQNIKDNVNKTFTTQQQSDYVKILLNQINKRDKIYQKVTQKLGKQRIQDKLNEFFVNYERMRKIIDQFKKMSKLNIENDQQLYQFLISQEILSQNNIQNKEISQKQDQQIEIKEY